MFWSGVLWLKVDRVSTEESPDHSGLDPFPRLCTEINRSRQQSNSIALISPTTHKEAFYNGS